MNIFQGRPEKRKAEEILVPEDFSDDDTIETLESGVLYLVNSQEFIHVVKYNHKDDNIHK